MLCRKDGLSAVISQNLLLRIPAFVGHLIRLISDTWSRAQNGDESGPDRGADLEENHSLGGVTLLNLPERVES